MSYAKIKDGEVVAYPYEFAQLQADNLYSAYPTGDVAYWFPLTDAATKEGFSLEPVTLLPRPAYDAVTQNCTPSNTPALVNGEWTVGWDVTAKSAAQLAEEANALTCTPRQGRLAMLEMGILDQIIAAYPSWPRATQIAWDYAVMLERADPQWDALGQMFNPPITPAQITSLFRLARTK